MDPLHTLSANDWHQSFALAVQTQAVTSLESGQVLFLPELSFDVLEEERMFLSSHYADPHSKNIHYHIDKPKLYGVQQVTETERTRLRFMIERYARHASRLIHTLLPQYSSALIMGRTSFRPVQIDGRTTSYRKDDKRLHVDAFPSSPNQGKRILRIFTNINPDREPRVWRLGEPFEQVVNTFLPKLRKPVPGLSTLLSAFKITKSRRTPYDHYMLQLHDHMKADEHYQKTAEQTEFAFPSGTSWIVQTDQVSHAAMCGQHVLEQTFYLPIAAMHNAQRSPVRVLEKMMGKPLV